MSIGGVDLGRPQASSASTLAHGESPGLQPGIKRGPSSRRILIHGSRHKPVSNVISDLSVRTMQTDYATGVDVRTHNSMVGR